MTKQKLYSFTMNRLLSYTPLEGFLSICLLLIISFLIVHVVKLCIIGYRSLKKDADSEGKDETPPVKPTPPAPVYYLVEKKKMRKRTEEYQPPKRISFDDK